MRVNSLMNKALRLTVSRGDEQLLTLETWEPIIIGRETGSDQSPPSFRTREKKCRVTVAGRDSEDISREHLLIEALDGGRVRVTNKSQRHGIQMSSQATLGKRESQELSLPVTLGVADLALLVEVPNEEEIPLRALDLAPPAPPGMLPARAGFSALPILEDNERVPDFYLRLAELGLSRLMGVDDLKALWEVACFCACELLQLDSAWVFHLEEREWVVKHWSRRGHRTREESGEASKFILGKVRDEKRTFWLTSQTGGLGVLPSAAAAPLLDSQGAVMGALYAHRLPSERPATVPFNRSLAITLELLASAVTSAQVRLRSGPAEVSKSTGTGPLEFFPPAVARRVADAPHLLDDREQEMALLEFKVRDFDELVAQVGPVVAGGRLQEVFEPVSECIAQNQGVVAELEDARIRAFWNAPVPQNDYLTLAAQAALAILARVNDLGVRWNNDLGRPLVVGITLHGGTFPVGRRGSKARFKYGPWSSAWTMNSRIQQVGAQLRTPLLVSKAVRSLLSQSFAGRRLGRLEAAGWSEPMELFELLDPTNKVFPIRARYEEALAAFERGDAEAATQRVAQILSEHPSDVPAYLLQMRALQAKLNRGAAVTGVLKLMDAGS
jgi:adenylate cyclase